MQAGQGVDGEGLTRGKQVNEARPGELRKVGEAVAAKKKQCLTKPKEAAGKRHKGFVPSRGPAMRRGIKAGSL
jgi:hypothetical protein